METWGRPSHRRGGRNNPSFSSSLLDAIYRSIDVETDGGGAGREQRAGRAPEHILFPSLPTISRKKQSTAAEGRPTAAVPKSEKPAGIRCKHEPSDHHHHQDHRRRFFTSTSSSSDGSSFGGFSSSDAESARPKPIRTAPPPARSERIRMDLPTPPPPHHQEKNKSGSIRSRFRDLRKRRGSAPASPGARLASFLNALFSGAGSPKKQKVTAPAAAGRGDESASSSASSYTRSCLIKTPPSGGRRGGKRSVRFGPVSVVVEEDCRPCGLKSLYDDGGDPAAAKAMDSRRMVEELLKGLEEEDDGGDSDSSSDLFELENLTPIGGGYRDELPVYGTTHLGYNHAVTQGSIL